MSPSPESLQERYAAIERVYAQQDWSGVERRSQALLAELPDDPRDPLRQRLVLLLAHTRLYGNGDPISAAALYQAVADADPEPVLGDIATQGLQHCAQLLPAAAGSEPEPLATTAATTAAAAEQEQTGPAMPWLEQLQDGVPDLQAALASPQARAPFQQPSVLEPVDVVEEPELIELALADPSRQDLVTVEARPESEPESRPETPPAPLRWPFMADHEDRQLPGSMPGQGSEADDPVPIRPPAPTPEPAPSPEPAIPPAEVAESLTQSLPEPVPVPVPIVEPKPMPEPVPAAHPFSPEELAELSRGLLGVPIR